MSARPTMGRTGRWLMIAAIVAVVATVAAALTVMDPPSQERAERLDRIRLEHLQMLAQRIDLHVEVAGALPAHLGELDAAPGDRLVDPVTAEPYGYRATGERTYRLCATFDTALDAMETGMRDAWRHPAGAHCFDRKAEPVVRAGVEVPSALPADPGPKPPGR